MQSKVELNPNSDVFRVLILEDVPTDAELVKRELQKAEIAFTSMHVDTRESFLKGLEDFSPDIILSDYNMPRFNGLEAIELVQERFPSIPLIIVTGSTNEETAVDCLKAGAADYVLKENLTRLVPAFLNTLSNKLIREEKEKSEKALRESEHYFRSLLHGMHETIMVIDKDYRITDINNMVLTSFGYRREDVIGQRCHKISHGLNEPCHRHGEVCLLGEVFETGQPRECRHEHQQANGSTAWVDILYSPLKDEAGNVTQVIEASRDVTDIYLKREALRAVQEKYSALLKNLPSVVFRGYKDWSVDFIDEKVESLTGYSADDFNSRRMKWPDVIVEKDIETSKESFIHALKTNKSYVREYRIKTKQGEILWLSERGQIICDAAGKIEYVDGVFFDITENKLADRALQESEEHFRKLFDNMVDDTISSRLIPQKPNNT
ncbi:PAS domain S-box protein, partial [Thermodesulfobacteriota bacterium]